MKFAVTGKKTAILNLKKLHQLTSFSAGNTLKLDMNI